MRADLKILPIVGLLLILAVQPGMAQVPDTATALPSLGDGLFSEAQVERGRQVFEAVCMNCHQPDQFVGPGFIDAWRGQTVDVLFELVRTTMPEDNPGKLKKKEYAAVLAFLFRLNGMPTGEADLPSTTRKLKHIRIDGPPGNKP